MKIIELTRGKVAEFRPPLSPTNIIEKSMSRSIQNSQFLKNGAGSSEMSVIQLRTSVKANTIIF